MEKVKISEAKIKLDNNKIGKVAILYYVGEDLTVLEKAVEEYVEHEPNMQLVDIHMDNPYTRVIISHPNDMPQEDFDPEKHKLNK
jgi:hypothetical protein